MTSNVVSPWYVRTDMSQHVTPQAVASSPAGRLIEVEEVVKVIERLCGEEGTGVTGKDLSVDGVNDPFHLL